MLDGAMQGGMALYLHLSLRICYSTVQLFYVKEMELDKLYSLNMKAFQPTRAMQLAVDTTKIKQSQVSRSDLPTYPSLLDQLDVMGRAAQLLSEQNKHQQLAVLSPTGVANLARAPKTFSGAEFTKLSGMSRQTVAPFLLLAYTQNFLSRRRQRNYFIYTKTEKLLKLLEGVKHADAR